MRSREVTTKASKGSKLRRGRTVDSSRKGRRIYTWNPISGFHGWKSREHCNGNREIMKRDISMAKSTVWGPQESVSGQVAHCFWSFVARSPETFASGFMILRTLKS
jgi:hypothetical protein